MRKTLILSIIFVLTPVFLSASVKPSSLVFHPEVEKIKGGENIKIEFKGNIGKVELWINDKKIGQKNSPAVFEWKIPSRDKPYKVEIRKDGKIIIGRYIPKKHPYFFFKDYKNSTIYRYRNEDPYKSWINECKRFSNDPFNAAFLQIIEPDKKYVEICKKALLNFKIPGDKYSQYYGLNMKYPIIYDIIYPYLDKESREKIEDRFMVSAQKMAQFLNKRIHCDVGGATIFASKLIVTCCAILGYHGKYQDNGNPYQLIDRALKYLFVSSPGYINGLGKGMPAFRWSAEISDGLCVPCGYRKYYCDYIAPFPVIYMNSTGVNLASKYKILHGHFFHHIGIMTPDLRLPNYNSKACWRFVWTDLVYAIPLYKGEQRKGMQWYANHIMKGRFKYHAGASILVYDKNEESHPPLFDGDPTYFSPSGQMAVFRSGWKKTSLYSFFKAFYEGDGHWSSNGELSFDLWAKGASLLVDSGECRWVVRGGAGVNTVTINGKTSGTEKITPPNPARLIDYFATPFLDYAEGKTKIVTVGSPWAKKLPSPVEFYRKIIFPHNEYFIVADRLDSDHTYTYRFQLLCGGTDIKNNVVSGKLIVEGKEVEWGKKFGVGKKKVPDCIEEYPGYRGLYRQKYGNVEYEFEKVSDVSWITKSLYLPGQLVKVNIKMVPECKLEVGCGVSHFGGYERKADYYHPIIRFKQVKDKAMYLAVIYPTTFDRLKENVPEITGKEFKDFYMASVKRGNIEDLIIFSKSGNVKWKDIETDGEILYCRKKNKNLETVMFAKGKKLAIDGKRIVSSEGKLIHFALEFGEKKLVGHVSVNSPTKISIYSPFSPKKIVWRRDKPVWVPESDSDIFEPVEIKFEFKEGFINLAVPSGKGKLFIE